VDLPNLFCFLLALLARMFDLTLGTTGGVGASDAFSASITSGAALTVDVIGSGVVVSTAGMSSLVSSLKDVVVGTIDSVVEIDLGLGVGPKAGRVTSPNLVCCFLFRLLARMLAFTLGDLPSLLNVLKLLGLVATGAASVEVTNDASVVVVVGGGSVVNVSTSFSSSSTTVAAVVSITAGAGVDSINVAGVGRSRGGNLVLCKNGSSSPSICCSTGALGMLAEFTFGKLGKKPKTVGF
jgi:hypothetical protein